MPLGEEGECQALRGRARPLAAEWGSLPIPHGHVRGTAIPLGRKKPPSLSAIAGLGKQCVSVAHLLCSVSSPGSPNPVVFLVSLFRVFLGLFLCYFLNFIVILSGEGQGEMSLLILSGPQVATYPGFLEKERDLR